MMSLLLLLFLSASGTGEWWQWGNEGRKAAATFFQFRGAIKILQQRSVFKQYL